MPTPWVIVIFLSLGCHEIRDATVHHTKDRRTELERAQIILSAVASFSVKEVLLMTVVPQYKGPVVQAEDRKMDKPGAQSPAGASGTITSQRRN